MRPKGKHSVLQTQLSAVMNAAMQSGQITWAFSELRCTFGGRSTVPDVSVFRWSRIPCDANGEISNTFECAPDWTIEILSPVREALTKSIQNQTRVTKNILHCLKHGNQMSWPIDPDEQTVFAYLPPGQVRIFDQPEELLPVPPFADHLQLTVGKLFGWLLIQSPRSRSQS